MEKEIEGVSCNVQNCKYHETSNKCAAGHINVNCDCDSAHDVKDTICQTFEECDNDNCGINPCDDNCDCDNDNCNKQ